ncbi:hypothetical protein Bca101_019012 [Brassica carinata]
MSFEGDKWIHVGMWWFEIYGKQLENQNKWTKELNNNKNNNLSSLQSLLLSLQATSSSTISDPFELILLHP